MSAPGGPGSELRHHRNGTLTLLEHRPVRRVVPRTGGEVGGRRVGHVHLDLPLVAGRRVHLALGRARLDAEGRDLRSRQVAEARRVRALLGVRVGGKGCGTGWG